MTGDQDKTTVFLSTGQIQNRVRELGREIQEHYRGRELLVLAVLQGSVHFFSDLVRQIDLPLRTEFLRISSYGDSTESSGKIREVCFPEISLKGSHVLLVEDIVDTGLSAEYLLERIEEEGAASVALVTLLEKRGKHSLSRPVDFVGFEIDDVFVVGYGLDSGGYYRNLPCISVLDLSS